MDPTKFRPKEQNALWQEMSPFFIPWLRLLFQKKYKLSERDIGLIYTPVPVQLNHSQKYQRLLKLPPNLLPLVNHTLNLSAGPLLSDLRGGERKRGQERDREKSGACVMLIRQTHGGEPSVTVTIGRPSQGWRFALCSGEQSVTRHTKLTHAQTHAARCLHTLSDTTGTRQWRQQWWRAAGILMSLETVRFCCHKESANYCFHGRSLYAILVLCIKACDDACLKNFMKAGHACLFASQTHTH